MGISHAALVAWQAPAKFVSGADAHKETVSQAVDVFHKVCLLGGPANVFEKGMPIRAMGPWPEGRLPTILCVLGFVSLLANHNHFPQARTMACKSQRYCRALAWQSSLARQ